MTIRNTLFLAALSGLMATSAFAASGDNNALGASSERSAKPAAKPTVVAAADPHAGHGKTRAEVLKELEEFKKNPRSHDGYCIDFQADGDARYVGPKGQC